MWSPSGEATNGMRTAEGNDSLWRYWPGMEAWTGRKQRGDAREQAPIACGGVSVYPSDGGMGVALPGNATTRAQRLPVVVWV